MYHSPNDSGHIKITHRLQKTPIQIYYEVHGNGPQRVLLIMGLSTPCVAWDYQTKFLVETGDYTVIVFDNRGVGHSDSPIGLYTTTQMALDTFALLDHFGWKSHVHLVGISMGGMISLEMVDLQPHRFQSLVLTSTTARRNLPTWKVISTLARIMFYKQPQDQLNAAIELIYPKDWLDQTPQLLSYSSNRELVIHEFIQQSKRSRPQPIQGHLGQLAACLGHHVSESRLKHIESTAQFNMLIWNCFKGVDMLFLKSNLRDIIIY
ncbi:putative aminoacrylate hydrolase RutD [Choanephora cucurbitarum]|uniref:Putative aminoacrylate hydrolase RutD n=1 Tax=Choanephora cucurbitarum TaxID=101091 RepID=A0A1C7NK77_9FUNG|nr:putative aminoacrylate hydrolase RutD [Choanephora cucurbitarum]